MKLHHIGTELPDRDQRDWVVSQELLDATGITYRQLDYWCLTGLLTTLDGNNPGSGWSRRFHETQVPRAATIAALLNAGINLATCRRVVDGLLADGRVDLGAITLTLTTPATTDPATSTATSTATGTTHPTGDTAA